MIIVNYNGRDHIQHAIESLKAQTVQDFELIVIDNASTDGSAEELDFSGLDNARLLRMDSNLGFAAGNNRAAAVAQGKWLVLMNPDVVAEPDWLEQLREARQRHPHIHSFTSAQLSLENPDILDGVGDAWLGFGFPWRGGFGHKLASLPGEGACFSACGAACTITRDLFLEHNGFDERYFCYCEDVDLGFRLQRAGEDCIFLPSARVRYAGSAISGRQSDFSIYYGTRNRLWTYVKNTPPLILLLTLPAHLALTFYVLVRSPAIGRFGSTLRGLKDGLLGLPRILGPSPWKTGRRSLPLGQLLSRMAWNPWRMSSHRAHVREDRLS